MLPRLSLKWLQLKLIAESYTRNILKTNENDKSPTKLVKLKWNWNETIKTNSNH